MKILYPVNISDQESWQKSLPIVKQYIDAFKASVHVITVVPDFRMSIVSDHFPEGTGRKMVESGQIALQKFVDEQFSGLEVPVTSGAAQGKVADAITRQAEKMGADLIIMTAHEKGVKDYFIGTNCNRVTAHATCSVLVVR